MTTADIISAESKLPVSIKALIAKKSRNKGSNYERDVAKKIAGYFGWDWNNCFIRTSAHAYAQPEGDLKPINEMNTLWKGAKLGPLECKNRMLWSFDQLYKTPAKSELYRYWIKSNEDTKSDNTILAFTKNGVSDLVMCLSYQVPVDQKETVIYCTIEGNKFVIVTLKVWLQSMWPR